MFKNILIPLDGSPQANVALPLARTLARDLGASITLLRVVHWPAEGDNNEATGAAFEMLSRITEELGAAGVSVEAVVRHGEAAEEILEQCRAQHADLILMRTHGRAGLERAVLGSVTQQVLKASHVPVMLLRAGGRHISQIRTMLVPVDGSPGGAVALGAALRLAQSCGAGLKLLQVAMPISTQFYVYNEYGGFASIDPAWDEQALAAATTYVNGLVKRLEGSKVQVEGQTTLTPDVAATIVDVADNSSADLIVMSTQALTGPARALLGSVSDAVVRHARCPVLLLHRSHSTDTQEQPEQREWAAIAR
jgi:nucleotide-binding universal stress UspA family protein